MAVIEMAVNMSVLRKQIASIADDQIPFAASMALTKTSRDAETALKHSIKRIFDRPVPFMQRAIQQRGSVADKGTRKIHPATIAIKEKQYPFLDIQITGGLRRAKKQQIPIPKNVERNGYGNMPRKGPENQNKFIKKLLKDPNNFEAELFGVLGIWSRGAMTAPKQKGGLKNFIGPSKESSFSAGKLRKSGKRKVRGKPALKPRSTHVKLLIRYEETAPYKAIFPYYKIIQKTVETKFQRNFSAAWTEALATRKPK